MSKNSKESEKQISPLLKLVIDLGPLILFFVADELSDIFVATGVLLVSVTVSFIASWLLTHKIPILPSVSLLFVLVFGGLTLFLGDEEFIKIEVSLTNALCGAALLAGLFWGQSLLKLVFGTMVDIDDEGWKKLTFRLGLFMIAIAVTNEIVRQYVSTDLWVIFRVYGILALNVVFLVTQIPIVKRHLIEEKQETSN
ncbi:MAG: septation protein IspZ [Sneathiella sp.]|nr:septation protein IspZ [Sneathiella sp.]